jgi:crossover junction endodeoxyribonuclease RusA
VTSLTITIDPPAKALSPNARVHFRVLAKAKAQARKSTRLLALAEIGRNKPPRWTKARIDMVWYHAIRNRRPDPLNIYGWLKGHADGLEDAGVVDDDRNLYPGEVRFEHDPETPRVLLCVRPITGDDQ